MSENVERKLLQLLDNPTVSPFGNPIPGLEELGGPGPGDGFRSGVVALPDAVESGPREVLVRRLGEPLQTDLELMGELSRLGVRPGRQVRAERTGGPGAAVRVGTAEGSLEVPAPAAHHVFVVPVGVS